MPTYRSWQQGLQHTADEIEWLKQEVVEVERKDPSREATDLKVSKLSPSVPFDPAENPQAKTCTFPGMKSDYGAAPPTENYLKRSFPCT